ncbi:hypothetical protein E2C01_089172 [Portunus trituberculatus]|uniref:Uncharacterized protein n=1 Tax=Portunus trituberculatus TaxID=210409 RepID=A0A5B7JCS9_PORTR|nr:hypothetical protein [Portunus trituberculatus]
MLIFRSIPHLHTTATTTAITDPPATSTNCFTGAREGFGDASLLLTQAVTSLRLAGTEYITTPSQTYYHDTLQRPWCSAPAAFPRRVQR